MSSSSSISLEFTQVGPTPGVSTTFPATPLCVPLQKKNQKEAEDLFSLLTHFRSVQVSRRTIYGSYLSKNTYHVGQIDSFRVVMSSCNFVISVPLQRFSFLSSKREASGHRRTEVNHYPSRRSNPLMSGSDEKRQPVQIPREFESLRVLGLGMSGVDILAQVPTFPRPDEKIRTTNVSMLGGGNAANSITAIRRLGIPCGLVSKVGNDLYGEAVLKELERDGIDTTNVLSKDGVNTSFTYVIIDSKENTRTCIATVSNEDLLVIEVHERMLDGVSLLALDGRHTLAALQLAKYARRKGIPILLDVERERPYIRDLLPYADYIVTNKLYPFLFFPDASSRIDAMQKLLEDCEAKLVISTLGALGSVLVRREGSRKKGTGHDMLVQSNIVKCHRTSKLYEVMECPAWPVGNIVDTTGAGDAFIGGVMYGLLTGMDYERMLCLASRVAAEKLRGLGSRSALPRREAIPDTLLASLPLL